MVPPAFGVVLRRLREERRLSLREVAQLGQVDHAYIYRLETGEKESPSEEVVGRLIRVLKPQERVAKILYFLATHPETDLKLVGETIDDPRFGAEDLELAGQIRFRGKARPSPKDLLERVKKLREEVTGG
jgi:HTH-type transcriptional regulator, competence development regulator